MNRTTTFLAHIIVKDATEVTSTPGTCGGDDARVPGTEYLIDTDRRVDRDDQDRQMRCSPATCWENDHQSGRTPYRTRNCHGARSDRWCLPLSVRFDDHALSRSPASIASADPDHLGRHIDQCQLDIPYQADVHHHQHHLRTFRVRRSPRSHL